MIDWKLQIFNYSFPEQARTDLTKAQIYQLQKALPKCDIDSNPKK